MQIKQKTATLAFPHLLRLELASTVIRENLQSMFNPHDCNQKSNRIKQCKDIVIARPVNYKNKRPFPYGPASWKASLHFALAPAQEGSSATASKLHADAAAAGCASSSYY
ncbi:hypothetical protein O6H91_06G022100 [Diphasiastrum complanatum]|uniref:Uncharacterized protein n=1 Tax=Diphasiastrum complanatum TaxID=34168 RepID=A0ACC2DBK6_DIPCM|nr:hypothetical protein O6H91_06G022100 [Diphasiastrum complanatum]